MSEIIQFGTFQIFFRSDGSCRLAPPYPASRRRPKHPDPLSSVVPLGTAPMETAMVSPAFLGAIRQGYIIPAPFDFRIDMVRGEGDDVRFPQRLPQDIDPQQYEHWAPFPDGHSMQQVAGSPWHKALLMALRGFWRIETPPGYSCLFVEPLNRNVDELPFYVAPQVVDTDRPAEPISFSLVARQPFPIAVAGGTPLVQVIPFERCQWDYKTVRLGTTAVEEIQEFRDAYWSCENRQFDEGADPTNPEHGYGAYAKLVKKHTRFE